MSSAAPSCPVSPDLAALLATLPLLLTIAVVAGVCHVHDRTVRRWVAEQRLRVMHAGGRVLVARSELERFLSNELAS